MVVTTRSSVSPVDALAHLQCNVFSEPAESGRLLDAFQALNITNIVDFLIMEQIDFESVILANSQPHNLSKLEIRKLLKAQEWYKTLPDSNKNVATWLDLTMDAFNTFMMNGHTIVTATIPVSAESLPLHGNNTGVLSTSPNADQAISSANEFAKGVKRDVTQYKEFNDDKKWIVWHCHFKSLAATHNIEDVLNKEYT
jgi:hypothetical protein